MSSFLLFKLLKESNQPIIIKGPAVNALKSTFSNMLGLGAPVEMDDVGFNQIDFPRARAIYGSPEFQDDGLTLATIRLMLAILNTYKNTQLPNYKELKMNVEAEVAKQMPSEPEGGEQAVKPTGENASLTVFRNQTSYEKLKIQTTEINDKSIIMAINKIVNKKLEAEGAEKEYNDWGTLDFHWKSKIKYYSKDKENPFIIWVHESILNDILEVYKKKGYEINFVGQAQAASKPTNTTEPSGSNRVKARVLGVENTQWGKKLAFTHDLPYTQWNEIRLQLEKEKLWKSSIGFVKDENGKPKYMLSLDQEGIKKVLEIMNSKIDTSEISNFILKMMTGITQDNIDSKPENIEKDYIGFVDVQNTNKIKIKFNRYIEASEFKHIKEMIVYTFPETHEYDAAGKVWILGGDYQQFALLGRLLKNYGYKVDDLRNVLKEKIKRNELKKEVIEGDVAEEQWSVVEKTTEDIVKSFNDEEHAKQFLNGLPNKQNYKIEHMPHFQAMINELLPNKSAEIELYDAQKEGIEFLFHRKRAILGDETGLGKTLQLISAAEIKMQESDYERPTLILAINDVTTNQWAEEIVKIIGAENKNLISTDCNNPKRWTVLNYNLFSYKKLGMEDDNAEKGCVSKLVNAKFGIVIFDELHKIKSDKTKRWQRLTKIIDNIPVRWGATATISANDAMDVKNQLLIINHHLGKLADGKFKRDFAGMELKDTPVGKRYQKGSEESRLEAAERLNKWLHLTGVYLRRKKSDVREMPNLSIDRQDVGIDVSAYLNKVNQRITKYAETAKAKGKSESLAEHLKDMIAQRTELATAKVPETLRITTDLVKKGKRVIVFTAFKESAELLKDGLSKIIPQINSNYKMLTYISSTSKDERSVVKKRFNSEEQYRVLLMSLKMGSTGIDFPNAASEMVINDYDWTPEQAEQSEGRIYRINTNQDININYVIAKNTYDEELYEIVQIKRRVAQEIQKQREEYRKEKDLKKAESMLKSIVGLQKKLIAADEKIKEIESAEIMKTAPTGSFKEFVEWIM